MDDEDDRPAGERISQAGEKLQRSGCAMTAAVTVPLLGLVVAGWVGLLIGLVVAAVVLAGMFRS